MLRGPLLAPSAPSHSDLFAALLMALSELLLATVNTIIKFVGGWSSERLMVVRFGLDFCLCATVCIVRGYGVPSREDLVTLVLRGGAYCGGVVFFWAALRSCLPIGDVVVLIVGLSPIFLVLLSRAVLGEVIPREWPAQMVLLLIGAALINKPRALRDDCPPTVALIPAGAAIIWAFMNFASRRAKHLPSVMVMLVSDAVTVTFAVLSAVVTHGDGAVAALTPPLDRDCALVVLSAVLGWTGLICNVKGYQSASVAAVASIAGTVSIPINYGFQILVFQDPIDGFSLAGASLVLATIIGMVVLKHRAATRKAGMAENGLVKP